MKTLNPNNVFRRVHELAGYDRKYTNFNVESPAESEGSETLLQASYWSELCQILLLSAGTVLSVAPLIGAMPCVDASHKKWLHVHVRPHARGMLKTIRVCCPNSLAWLSILSMSWGHCFGCRGLRGTRRCTQKRPASASRMHFTCF